VKLRPVCSTEDPDDIRFCQSDDATLRAAFVEGAPLTDLLGRDGAASALKWASTGLSHDSGLSSCRDLEQKLGGH
jgi:hypothetical protein